MIRARAERSIVAVFDQCSFLVFHTAVVFALIHSCRGQSEVIGPPQPLVALIGDDIVLPCHLDPVMDASDMTVEWARPDLDPRFVLVWRDGVDLESKKHPLYDRRTSLFTHELKSGNISLKISKVKQSDGGTYRCFVPELKRDAAVQLVVGAASSPVAQINRTTSSSSRVVLQCESAGWYPEPELLWVDGEGNLLPAGPTETLKGPGDLYTVSSRATVEKRHSNNITCRVQQKNINQSRETHIHVPDDFFMVISPSSPPSDPAIDPNTITALVIGAVVVLVLILAVFCVVWKRRRFKCRNKNSEEDGPEQTRKEKMIESKNDHHEFQVVMEEGESEPLMAGREEEDDVDSRGEQRHEDERETKQDQFVLETEQTKENPQEKRINPSVVDKQSLIPTEKETQEDVTGREGEDDVESRGEKNSKEERETRQDETETEQRRDATNTSAMTETESQIKMKQETREEQEVTGRQERNNVESRGEQSNKDERETQDHQEELKDGFRRTEEERINPFILTEKVSQSAAGQENGEKLEMRGRGMKAEGKREKKMEGGKNYSGLQFFPLTEEHKEQPVLVKEAKSFNVTSHLNSDQKPRREKETQKEQLVAVRQRESDVRRKQSDCEKKRSEENRIEEFKAQKKKREHQREKLLTERREKNQRKQSESRMEREKDETEVKIRKSRNQHHKEENTRERREEEPENEKHGEGNQRDRTGMTERKREEQRGQEESRNSSVSSKVTLNTDLTTQEKRRGQNQETQAEETSEIREQPEKQRRAQSEGGGQREMMEINEGVTADGANRKEREKLQLTHEGALQAEQQENVNQKEEAEEPVSVTERGVNCLEEPQKQELRDETPDVDQNNVQRRKRPQETKPHEVCEESIKKQKIQKEDGARKQNFRKVKKCVKKQNDDHVEVNDAAHSQSAAITQQHETIKWTKEQQMLSEQKETQEYLTEHDEDQMETEEHSGLQFPPFTEEHKEQPVLLAGAESFSFTFHLNSDHGPRREKETEQPEKQRRAQSEGGGQREMMEINEGVTADETNRKEREKLQLTHEGGLQAEQQENVNQKEEPEEPVSVTERGVNCLEEPQKQELRDGAPDVDQNNIQSRKHTQEIKLHEVCEQSFKKEKIQEARKHQNVRKVKKCVKKQKDDDMEVDDAAHSQSAAITQQHETIKWNKEQPMLSEQKDTQEYLTEHEEEPMEVEEHSGLQFPPFTQEPKEQPVLLAGAEPFNFTLLLHQESQKESSSGRKSGRKS